MEDQSCHLEKMGRELKCPICLSLLNSAVSLTTCNHVFCNSCIMKSMKSATTCPVCKVPYRRREIRPAAHMDNLVSIYKTMEVASGFNIFVTQNAPPTKLPDEQEQLEGDTNGNKEVDRTCRNKVQNQHTSTKGGSRTNIKSKLETPCPITSKPSFPAKKRVQVPKNPVPESPAQLQKLEIRSGESNKDEPSDVLVAVKKNPVFNERGKPVLSPFFWLRDEEDADNLSQSLEGGEDQLLSITPPNIPTFSDIKDSDDGSPSKSSQTGGDCGNTNPANLFDSEIFEWTQRPCSPELFSTSDTMLPGHNNEAHEIQESKSKAPSSSTSKENKKNVSVKRVGSADEAMPAVSSLEARTTNSLNGQNKSRKRARIAKEAILKNCTKRHRDLSVFSEESRKAVEKEAPSYKDSAINLKTRKMTKEAGSGISVAVINAKSTSAVSLGAKTRNQSDEKMDIQSPALLCKEQGGEEYKTEKGTVGRVISNKCQTDCSLVFKERKLDCIEINEPEEVYTIVSQMDEDENPQVSSDGKQGKHGQAVNSKLSAECNKVLKSKKNEASFHGISEEVLANDHREGHRGASVKESHLTERVCHVSALKPEPTKKAQCSLHAQIFNNSEAMGPTNGAALHECRTLTNNIQCAFCHSSEDSEASGEMVHYCNGRPVAADYNGGSKIIHCHRGCAEWAPNVYFEDATTVNLEAELSRSRRIKCCCCGLKGAALGCYERSCRKSFHVPCAKMIPQCRWDTDNFVMLCPLHVSSKLPNEDSGSQKRRKSCIPTVKMPQSNQVVHEENISPCQTWNSFVTPSKLAICCSALTVRERDIVSLFERLSGITVLKNWDSTITHVIASTDENGACKRTLKILMGILEGKWILNLEWIRACLKAKKLVKEEQYEIAIDVHGIRNGPRHGRLRVLNKEPKIFEGFKFYFMGDIEPSYKGYIEDLLIAGGGIVLHRKPISEPQDALLVGSFKLSTFIIYSLELPGKCDPNKKNMILDRRQSDAEALARSTGAKAVSNMWVLNCIAACKVQGFAE